MQCMLSRAGAVDLVIDLIVMDPSYEIFLKTCQLAKALLWDGNEEVGELKNGNTPLDNSTMT